MQRPDLSIIIPVYNGQEYLVACTDSIMRQKDSEKYEIIAVNDGSTDNSPKILKAAADIYKNFHVINQKNAGVSVARNNGILASHGKYVTFVDCDDMVGMNIKMFEPYLVNCSYRNKIGNLDIASAHTMPQKLTDKYFDDKYFVNMLDAAKNSDADVVLGGKVTLCTDQFYIRRHTYANDFVYGTEPNDKDILLRQADVRENANFALYSRQMLDSKNLRFFANMKLDEDMLFCMLAVLYAQRVATVPDVTYFYNRHENTLSNISDTEERFAKQKLADIQRFSYLLNEIGKMPQYAKIFNYWLIKYSEKGTKYIYEPGEFPPRNCASLCPESTCDECFISDALREQFRANIAKNL